MIDDITLKMIYNDAIRQGWECEQRELVGGVVGYSIKTPNGEYVQHAGSELDAWRSAYERGLLPMKSSDK